MPHWGKNSNSQTAKRIWNPWPPDSNSLHHARHCHMAAPQKPGSGASKHIIHSPELSLESFCYSKTLYIGYCFPVKLQLSEERSQQKATGTEDWISVTIPSFTSGFPREMCQESIVWKPRLLCPLISAFQMKSWLSISSVHPPLPTAWSLGRDIWHLFYAHVWLKKQRFKAFRHGPQHCICFCLTKTSFHMDPQNYHLDVYPVSIRDQILFIRPVCWDPNLKILAWFLGTNFRQQLQTLWDALDNED